MSNWYTYFLRYLRLYWSQPVMYNCSHRVLDSVSSFQYWSYPKQTRKRKTSIMTWNFNDKIILRTPSKKFFRQLNSFLFENKKNKLFGYCFTLWRKIRTKVSFLTEVHITPVIFVYGNEERERRVVTCRPRMLLISGGKWKETTEWTK